MSSFKPTSIYSLHYLPKYYYTLCNSISGFWLVERDSSTLYTVLSIGAEKWPENMLQACWMMLAAIAGTFNLSVLKPVKRNC